MARKKVWLIGIVVAVLITGAVYAYYFNADSQSAAVQRVDPRKAQLIRQVNENFGNGVPPSPGPLGLE
ncbi:MAG: hypothetical protein AMXMBFR82_14950 [Candidatus Hydrogenedentota bacterium]